VRGAAEVGEPFPSARRWKSKLEAGGNSGVGGGWLRGLPARDGRSGLVAG
jgi:hypothetical protein